MHQKSAQAGMHASAKCFEEVHFSLDNELSLFAVIVLQTKLRLYEYYVLAAQMGLSGRLTHSGTH